MEEAFERAFVVAVAVHERTVVVTAVVGVGVMPAVIGDPRKDRALKRHGTAAPSRYATQGSVSKLLCEK